MSKPFKSLDDQIDILINRNLVIGTRDSAKYLLSKNSYYSVINGYKDIFLKSKTTEFEEDEFEDGTTLEDIIELYLFDKKIRNEVMSALGSVEETLSANIAYILGERFGYKQGEYIAHKNFKLGKRIQNGRFKGRFDRDYLIHELNKICHSEEHPMRHYREKYNDVPPWIMVKGATLGTLVYIYKLFKKDEKEYLISRCLGIAVEEIDENLKEFFSKMLDVFRKFRNWAAHGGRIFSHKVKEELPYYQPAYATFKFEKEKYNTGQGKNDFFALVVALNFFLQSDRYAYAYFKVGIPFHLKNFGEKNPLYYLRVLEHMGLPFNYYEALATKSQFNHKKFLDNVDSSNKAQVIAQ